MHIIIHTVVWIGQNGDLVSLLACYLLTLDSGVPVNASDEFVFRESEVSERLVFFEISVRLVPCDEVRLWQIFVVICEYVHDLILLEIQFHSSEGLVGG